MQSLPQHIVSLIQSYTPITLPQLDAMKLMNRVDTKFIFNTCELEQILAHTQQDYQVLEIDGRRLFNYESLYFDTHNFTHYYDHHNGKPSRTKVRYRKYADTGDVFFEVKMRSKDSRTDKQRIKRDAIYNELNGTEHAFMQGLALKHNLLEEKIWIYYKRLTLASLHTQERVTLDLQMRFETKDKSLDFPNLVVAEIKQDRYSRISKFSNVLRSLNIPDFRISKYAIAVAMMQEGIKTNAFKEKINRLNKVSHGNTRAS
jgi:hypothetical protein